jgi:hypothetical protein
MRRLLRDKQSGAFADALPARPDKVANAQCLRCLAKCSGPAGLQIRRRILFHFSLTIVPGVAPM